MCNVRWKCGLRTFLSWIESKSMYFLQEKCMFFIFYVNRAYSISHRLYTVRISVGRNRLMGEEGACTPNSILKDQMECLKQAPAL